MSRKRFAQIVASTVEVLCPFCGEPQPSPGNGSEAWMPPEVFAEEQRERICVSCDELFVIVAPSTARFFR